MKIIINTTTFPSSKRDYVPAFVLDQVREMHALNNALDIDVLIPHNAYFDPVPNIRKHESHREHRYHYFFPHSVEKLAGRGILPALKENPFRFGLIPFFLIFQFRSLDRLCKRTKPDLVYAHWFMTPAIISYLVCKRRGIPLVFTTHASDMSVLGKIPFAGKLVARVMNYATHYTAVSNRTANKMKAFFSSQEWNDNHKNKLSIIPMGTELFTKSIPKKLQQQLLSKSRIDTNKKYILCMGRLSEKKGFRYLIEAYSLMNEKLREEYQLVIAGDGQLLGDLKKRAADIDETGIIFTGYVSGELKNTLLANASVFVLPSIIDDSGDSEGLPVVMMEALAQGKIVIATDVSGAEEVLTQNTGIIINQKSPEDLKNALTSIFSLPSEEKSDMQKFARELAKNFQWSKIAHQHLEILKRAAGVN